MYEKFTDRARKVVQLAQSEAQRFNHEYIGTEHVLLGLLKEGNGTGATVLKSLGIDLRKIRLKVEKLVQSGPDMVTIGKLPQTPRAKKVFEYAVEEARDLDQDRVGTEHILLGLLREEDGVAAQVLMSFGLNLEEVRAETFKSLGLPQAKQVLKTSVYATLRKLLFAEFPDSKSAIAPKISRNLSGKASLIAVDIGNSQIKLGQFPDDEKPENLGLREPIASLELPVVHKSGLFDFDLLASWCEKHLASDSRWLVGSVHRSAAELLAALINDWSEHSNLNWCIRRLTYIDLPIPIRVDEPARVGIDRLLAAVAANRLRQRERPAIVVDLGTAITVDLVEADGAFAGGAILPGISTSAKALHDHTAALPQVAVERLQSPPAVPGKSTTAAIEAGLYWGAMGAIRELVSQMSAKLPNAPELFITGGGAWPIAELLSDNADRPIHHVPNLVLSGVALVAEHLKSPSPSGRGPG